MDALADPIRRLEHEGLIQLALPFALADDEAACLNPPGLDARAKNISLSPGAAVAKGVAPDVGLKAGALMSRYAAWAETLVGEIAPGYVKSLERGRTSLRTRPVGGAGLSPRKDDRRLHVDAFASQPTNGKRILRVFSNINPDGDPRLWRVGEPFEAYARRWIGKVRSPLFGESWTLHRLGVTKSRRTAYDALMLGLHDAAKLDADYQRHAPRHDVAFPAGSSWIVFTDSTVHAAIAGRHALEQTFYLPVAAMGDATASPLRVLERMVGRGLV